jgi:hypothetical protein
MMCVAGFFLAVLAFLAALVVGAWLASLVLLIAGRINRSTILTVVSGGAFFVLTALLLFVVASYLHARSPHEMFKRSFGFEPPPDVKDIQSEYYYLLDSGYTYLKFQTSPTTVERIVARGLEQVPNSYRFPSSNLEPPEWWKPPATGDVVRYYGEFDGRDFAREHEVLIYDRSSNTVYFHFLGID